MLASSRSLARRGGWGKPFPWGAMLANAALGQPGRISFCGGEFSVDKAENDLDAFGVPFCIEDHRGIMMAGVGRYGYWPGQRDRDPIPARFHVSRHLQHALDPDLPCG